MGEVGAGLVGGLWSVPTAGLGNFVVATAEWIGSFTTSLFALLFPLVTLVLLVTILIVIFGRRGRRLSPKPGAAH